MKSPYRGPVTPTWLLVYSNDQISAYVGEILFAYLHFVYDVI
jgi:hypothetical protein